MYSEKHCIITIDGNKSLVEGKCLLTDKLVKVKVKTKDYNNWVKGEGNIDELMPYLSASERHFLAHGVTDEGWEEVTKPKISIPKAQ